MIGGADDAKASLQIKYVDGASVVDSCKNRGGAVKGVVEHLQRGMIYTDTSSGSHHSVNLSAERSWPPMAGLHQPRCIAVILL